MPATGSWSLRDRTYSKSSSADAPRTAAVARGTGDDDELGLSARVGRAPDVDVELGVGATIGTRGRAHAAAKREAPERSTQSRSARRETVILRLTIGSALRRNATVALSCRARRGRPRPQTVASAESDRRTVRPALRY